MSALLTRLQVQQKKISVTLSSKSSQAKKQALAMLDEKAKKAIAIAVKDLTLEDVLREIEEKRKSQVKETTLKAIKTANKIILRAFPVGVKISKITSHMAEDSLNQALQSYSKSYARICIARFKSTMKYAQKRKYNTIFSFNDFEFVQPKTVKKAPSLIDPPDIPDILNKIKAASNERYALVCEFQILTGLRIGELMALRWCDYKDGIIDVNGTMTRNGKRTTPKTIHSYREIKLNDRAKEILSYFRKQHLKSLWGKPIDEYENERIFKGQNGGFIWDTEINSTLKKVDYKIPLTTHAFRHTHISLLLEMGVPIKAIMERVGHSNPNLIFEVYGHFTSKMKKELEDKMESLSFGS